MLLAGKATPLSYLEPGHGKDFVRARVHIHPTSGEPVIKNRTLEEVHDKLEGDSWRSESRRGWGSMEGMCS